MIALLTYALCAASATQAIQINLQDGIHAVYGGQTAQHSLVLRNNGVDAFHGRCRVWNHDLDLDHGATVAIDAGGATTVPVTWTAPVRDSIMDATWAVRLEAQGATVDATVSIGLYPPSLIDGAYRYHHKQMVRFDPQSRLSALLMDSGVSPSRVALLRDLEGIDILMLGPECLDDPALSPPERIEELRRFVIEGGVLMVFHQNEALPFHPDPRPVAQAPPRVADVVAPRNLLLRGMKNEHWNGWGDVLGTGGYAPWERLGEKVYLADEQGNTLAGEYQIGQGLLLVCQVDVAGWYREAPAAAALFKALMDRAIDFVPERREVGLIDDEDGETASLLDDLGVAWGRVRDATSPDLFELFIIDATAAEQVPLMPLTGHLAHGAQALVLGATPGTTNLCHALCGHPVTIEDATLTRLVRGAELPLNEGLANPLLYDAGRLLATASIHIDHARARPLLVGTGEHATATALIHAPAGAGRLYVSTMRHADSDAGRLALARMLTNLRAAIRQEP